MGEYSAMEESTLGYKGVNAKCCRKNNHVLTTGCSHYMHSFFADTLKYVHADAFGYNKCKFNSTLEAALVVWSINGEVNA